MDQYDIVNLEMKQLEELYDVFPKEALIKMIELFNKASDVYNHEVCDRIDSWIYEMANYEILDYLKDRLKKEPTNQSLLKWNKWIETKIN